MDYDKISKDLVWSPRLCTYCNICVQFCPVKTLEIKQGRMIDKGKCIRCKLCEKYCPSFAIEVMDGKKPSAGK